MISGQLRRLGKSDARYVKAFWSLADFLHQQINQPRGRNGRLGHGNVTHDSCEVSHRS